MATVAFFKMAYCACLIAAITAATPTDADTDRTKKSADVFNGQRYDDGQYHANPYHNHLFNTGKYDPLFDNSPYYNPTAAAAAAAAAAVYNAKYNSIYNPYNPYINNPYNPLYNPYLYNAKYNPYHPANYLGNRVAAANYQAAYPGSSVYQTAYQAAYPGAYPYGRVLPTSAYIAAQAASQAKSGSAQAQASAGPQRQGY